MAKSARRRASVEAEAASPRARQVYEPVPASEGDVARRAYRLYLARGAEHGHALDDWLQAERELRSEFATTIRD